MQEGLGGLGAPFLQQIDSHDLLRFLQGHLRLAVVFPLLYFALALLVLVRHCKAKKKGKELFETDVYVLTVQH